MIRYLLGRVLRIVLSMVAVSMITFGLLQLVPGSFSELQGIQTGTGLGDVGSVQGESQQSHGEDVPAWRQYLLFMQGAVTGNMGPSYKYPNLTIEEIIATAFPVSLSLAVASIILTLLIAIPVGVLSAVKKDTAVDHGSMFTLTLSTALPGYLMALVLVLIFSAALGWLPTGGWTGPLNMVIPVLALAVQPTATLARYVRSSVLQELRQEYVVAAYAKGGARRTVLSRHVLRNSLIPVVTVVGPLFAGLATGTVFIESLMSIPGLGMYFTVAARSRDMPLLMGTTLFFALLIMVLNLIVDLTYGVLDPRIRHERTNSGAIRRKRRSSLAAGLAATPLKDTDVRKAEVRA
jgi:ABC-type dipeptide/oligopeptide/nickel transport system permease component